MYSFVVVAFQFLAPLRIYLPQQQQSECVCGLSKKTMSCVFSAVGYIPTGHADVKFETRESIYNTEFIASPEDVKNQQYISSDSERSFTNTY